MSLRRYFARFGRRLFWKIFLAFWLAMSIAGIGLLAVENTRAVRLAQRWRGVTGDALSVYATTAVRTLPAKSTPSLRDFLKDLEKRTRIRAWLFDSQGNEVSRYATKERAKQPIWLRQRMAQLVQEARASDATEYADLEGLTLGARSAQSADGNIYVLVGLLPDARYDFWGAIPVVQIMRFLAVLVVAGTVSWILAWHLASPLEALRAATRRLAAGDFSARAPELRGRRDELAGLAIDFNDMAEYIDSLLRKERHLVMAQQTLLADVAHELRSPLARVNVALELARESLEKEFPNMAGGIDPSQTRAGRSLDRIERENGQLTDLIDRLLVVSRLESGVMPAEFSRVDLEAVVREVVLDADFEAEPSGRRVIATVEDGCVVLAAKSLLESAVENVVRNAVRHTAEGTAVRVTLTHQYPRDAGPEWNHVGHSGDCFTSPLPHTTSAEGYAVVTVRDFGPGLPADEMGEIFRPFYRARASRDRNKGGGGLGLTITARAVELHGGQYRVCNMPDGGLQVELRLPINPVPPLTSL